MGTPFETVKISVNSFLTRLGASEGTVYTDLRMEGLSRDNVVRHRINWRARKVDPKTGTVDLTVPRVPMRPGEYRVVVEETDSTEYLVRDGKGVEVKYKDTGWVVFQSVDDPEQRLALFDDALD